MYQVIKYEKKAPEKKFFLEVDEKLKKKFTFMIFLMKIFFLEKFFLYLNISALHFLRNFSIKKNYRCKKLLSKKFTWKTFFIISFQ